MSSDFTMQQIEKEFDKLIEERAKKYRNRWIPCSERMPKKRGYYLSSIIDKMGGLLSDISYYDGENFVAIDYGSFDYILNVNAWMPMPEPYKGGNK